ncbi:hypothetical protein Btru_033917 [Bulinus truncatus]|nr:hypothetical protein Btru_033917 [Bulinus truncatus]
MFGPNFKPVNIYWERLRSFVTVSNATEADDTVESSNEYLSAGSTSALDYLLNEDQGLRPGFFYIGQNRQEAFIRKENNASEGNPVLILRESVRLEDPEFRLEASGYNQHCGSQQTETQLHQHVYQSCVTSHSEVVSLSGSPSFPNYESAVTRLATFSNWNADCLYQPKKLAEAGLFCISENYLRCFQCGLGLKQRQPDDDVLVDHLNYRPHCSFANLYQAFQDHYSTSGGTQVLNKKDVSQYSLRQASFLKASCPIHLQNLSKSLARSGLFWTGRENIVHCFHCTAAWCQEPGDDPVAIHRNLSPQCNFTKQPPRHARKMK